jgi:hypothetical protein
MNDPEEIVAQPLCPSCRRPVEPSAVLCIACGYHFALGKRLETVFERETPRVITNPYAAPAIDAQPARVGVGETSVFDLTESGARQAKAVVDDAGAVHWMILLSACICGIAWAMMLPWYGYRLYMWHRLREQFAELRQPNAFSTHAEITARFPEARVRLIVGVVFGALFWHFLAAGFVLNLILESGV